jgi:hypothetical protein
MRFRLFVVRQYEWCQLCKTRAADTGGILCARCKGAIEVELERLLKENS